MKLASNLKPKYCETFIHLLAVNVDNKEIDEKQFRQFVRNSLEIFEQGEVGAAPITRETRHSSP
jgi:hypothetical protein